MERTPCGWTISAEARCGFPVSGNLVTPILSWSMNAMNLWPASSPVDGNINNLKQYQYRCWIIFMWTVSNTKVLVIERVCCKMRYIGSVHCSFLSTELVQCLILHYYLFYASWAKRETSLCHKVSLMALNAWVCISDECIFNLTGKVKS